MDGTFWESQNLRCKKYLEPYAILKNIHKFFHIAFSESHNRSFFHERNSGLIVEYPQRASARYFLFPALTCAGFTLMRPKRLFMHQTDARGARASVRIFFSSHGLEYCCFEFFQNLILYSRALYSLSLNMIRTFF